MPIDVAAATAFLTTHARVIDRRRMQLLLCDDADAQVVAEGLLEALAVYGNNDGGFGWGFEPDLRAPESQPPAAMHAFEVLAEVAARAGVAAGTTPRAVTLCRWLSEHSLTDGGLPFALPIADAAGCAPFWADADPTVSSLQMTAQVAATALALAQHTPSVAGHPWLATATAWCFDAIDDLVAAPGPPPAYVLLFAVRFLDAAAESHARAGSLLEAVAPLIPDDGAVPVTGGAPGEALKLLDLAPHPQRPVRHLFPAAAVEADLDRLERGQQDDGGWRVDHDAFSPAAALEWRGYATVQAVRVLRANGRV
jgi:hypothetical protein